MESEDTILVFATAIEAIIPATEGLSAQTAHFRAAEVAGYFGVRVFLKEAIGS
jgi:hypothetical protein